MYQIKGFPGEGFRALSFEPRVSGVFQSSLQASRLQGSGFSGFGVRAWGLEGVGSRLEGFVEGVCRKDIGKTDLALGTGRIVTPLPSHCRNPTKLHLPRMAATMLPCTQQKGVFLLRV